MQEQVVSISDFKAKEDSKEKVIEPDTGVNISKDSEQPESPVEKKVRNRTAAKYVYDNILAPLEKVSHLLGISRREKPINLTGFVLENLELIASCFPAIVRGLEKLEEEEADITLKLHRLNLDLMRWQEDRIVGGVHGQLNQISLTLQQMHVMNNELRMNQLNMEHRMKVLFYALCETGIFSKEVTDVHTEDFENNFVANTASYDKISARIFEERMALEKLPGRYGEIRLKGGLNTHVFNISEVEVISFENTKVEA